MVSHAALHLNLRQLRWGQLVDLWSGEPLQLSVKLLRLTVAVVESAFDEFASFRTPVAAELALSPHPSEHSELRTSDYCAETAPATRPIHRCSFDTAPNASPGRYIVPIKISKQTRVFIEAPQRLAPSTLPLSLTTCNASSLPLLKHRGYG